MDHLSFKADVLRCTAIMAAATIKKENNRYCENAKRTRESNAERYTVSFHQVQIREYSRCLGDHPEARSGPPLSIIWDYMDETCTDVEEYERNRPLRRSLEQMAVPSKLRREMLLNETDSTAVEIEQVMKEAKKERDRRLLSMVIEEFEGCMIAVETICRRWRRFRKGISKKKEQDQLWKDAHIILSDSKSTSNIGG